MTDSAEVSLGTSNERDPWLGEILITEEQLQQRVRELGAQISADYVTRELVLIGILRGSVIFVADLMRSLSVPVTLDFLAISSYHGRNSSGVVRLLKDLDQSITGKDVLLVEDIIDTGLTLNYVLRVLATREPASLAVCTLLNKPARRLIEHPLVKYVGFDIPDVFVVGYGLDYNQRYRNLPYICALKVP
jgi:hypoxanthine phosphoribosyltransferase